MVVETIHVMDASETTSEAFKNYAGAAFLVGMAVLSIGIGAGIIAESVRKLRRPATSTFTEDLVETLRKKTAGKTADDIISATADAAVEGLRKTMDDILTGHHPTMDQITSKDAVMYSVKKSYKGEVKVGDMIPEDAVTAKPEGMSNTAFMKMDNIKVKSRTIVRVHGGLTLVVVEELLNTDHVKPV